MLVQRTSRIQKVPHLHTIKIFLPTYIATLSQPKRLKLDVRQLNWTKEKERLSKATSEGSFFFWQKFRPVKNMTICLTFFFTLRNKLQFLCCWIGVNSLLQVGCGGLNSWVSHQYTANTSQTLDGSTSFTAARPEPDNLAALWAQGKSCQLALGGEKRKRRIVVFKSKDWISYDLLSKNFTKKLIFFFQFENYEHVSNKIINSTNWKSYHRCWQNSKTKGSTCGLNNKAHVIIVFCTRIHSSVEILF